MSRVSLEVSPGVTWNREEHDANDLHDTAAKLGVSANNPSAGDLHLVQRAADDAESGVKAAANKSDEAFAEAKGWRSQVQGLLQSDAYRLQATALGVGVDTSLPAAGDLNKVAAAHDQAAANKMDVARNGGSDQSYEVASAQHHDLGALRSHLEAREAQTRVSETSDARGSDTFYKHQPRQTSYRVS